MSNCNKKIKLNERLKIIRIKVLWNFFHWFKKCNKFILQGQNMKYVFDMIDKDGKGNLTLEDLFAINK